MVVASTVKIAEIANTQVRKVILRCKDKLCLCLSSSRV